MGLLDNLERGIERVVRGAFSRGTKAQVQPIEIASRLRRDIDARAMTLSEGRTLVPNVFTVRLADRDFNRVREWGSALAEELCDVVIRHVNSQRYTLPGSVRVSFTKDEALSPGEFEIDSHTEKDSSSPEPVNPPSPARQPQRPPGQRPALQPVLDIAGQRYSLNAESIILGRSSEADILIDDTGVSRRHLEIRTQNGRSVAVDLGSTNGSWVNGQRIDGQADLLDGSVITMGRTRITFRLLSRGGGR